MDLAAELRGSGDTRMTVTSDRHVSADIDSSYSQIVVTIRLVGPHAEQLGRVLSEYVAHMKATETRPDFPDANVLVTLLERVGIDVYPF